MSKTIRVSLLALVTMVSAGSAAAQSRAPRGGIDRSWPMVDPAIIPPMTIEIPEITIEPMMIDPMTIAPMALQQAQAALEGIQGRLQGLDGLVGLEGLKGLAELSELSDLSEMVPFVSPRVHVMSPRLSTRMPPEAWAQGDPADSLYKAARQALNQNDYRVASDLFAQIRQRFPKSNYVADALYWDAFARYRLGGDDRLRTALDLLDQLRRQYPRGNMRSDATTLATRIRGELARRGDPEAAEAVAAIAGEVAPVPPVPAVAPVPATPATPVEPRVARQARPPRNPRVSSNTDDVPAGCSTDDYEDKVAALNALLQMNSERALPILKGLLQRRDECSAPLRRKAVFLIAQQKSDESIDILLAAVKSDPDPEVRKQGVFWLGQVEGDRAVDILGDILKTSDDFDMQKRAMFALSQHRSPKAGQIIRDYAGRSDAPLELRKQAIFDIGQQQSSDNAAFLRGLYGKLTDQDLKERVLFSISQMRGEGTGKWLLEIAANTSESIEMRKKALFWAGQQSETEFAAFSGLYDKMPDREMKKQLIYVFSQRRETEAVDRLLEIAQKETDRELKKQAMFWLAQSRDPRVAKFLEDVINR